jgi:hypothetical protein
MDTEKKKNKMALHKLTQLLIVFAALFGVVGILNYLHVKNIDHYMPGVLHVVFITINFLRVMYRYTLRFNFVARYTVMSLFTSGVFFGLCELVEHYLNSPKVYVVLGCFFTITYSTFIYWLITQVPETDNKDKDQ